MVVVVQMLLLVSIVLVKAMINLPSSKLRYIHCLFGPEPISPLKWKPFSLGCLNGDSYTYISNFWSLASAYVTRAHMDKHAPHIHIQRTRKWK